MQAYKALYLNKAQDTIFGLEVIGEKSGGKKDPVLSIGSECP